MRKRVLWIWLLAAALCLALCGGAMGEEKQEGLFYPSYMEGEFFSNYAGTPGVTASWDVKDLLIFPPGSEYDWDQDETPISWEITFVSGDEALKDLFYIDDGARLCNRLANQAVEGEGTWRITLESEHYRASGEIKATILDFTKYDFSLKKDTLSVPLGTEVYFRDLLSSEEALDPQTEAFSDFWVYAHDAEGNTSFETDGLTVDYSTISGKAPGDYPLSITMSVGEDYLEIAHEITVHVADETESDALLDQIRGRRSFTEQGTFSDKEKVNAKIYSFYMPYWVYAPSTLPDYIQSSSNVTDDIKIVQDGKESYDQAILPDRLSVEWISGDEALRDKVGFFETTDYNGDPQICLEIKLSAITAPGEATFRIKLGTDKLYCEQDYTLRAVSWADYPLFELPDGEPTAYVKRSVGEPFADYSIELSKLDSATQKVYPAKDLISMWGVRDYSRDVVNGLLPEADQESALSSMGSEGTLLSAYLSSRGPSDNQRAQEIYVYDPNPWSYYGYSGTIFWQYGSYPFHLSVYGNLGIFVDREMNAVVLPYDIVGPSTLAPGAEGTYTVRDDEADSGRTFTLSLEGEGASFDPATGILKVAEETPEETKLNIAATPSDGGARVSTTVTVSRGVIGNEEFREEKLTEGFTVPIFSDTAKYEITQPSDNRRGAFMIDGSGPYRIDMDYLIYNPLDEFAESEEVALREYDDYALGNLANNPQDVQQETFQVDGHPARAIVVRVTDSNGNDSTMGGLFYVRNNRMLRIRLQCRSETGVSFADLPKVTLSDLRKIGEMITYNPAEASITAADGLLSLSAKGDPTALSGGKKLQLTASFANPDRVNKKAKNNTVEWAVADAETGEAVEGVKIDTKGNLSADKKLAEVRQVKVTASSAIFHTSADYALTVIPSVSAFAVEPKTLTFYEGEIREETVRAALTPDTVPPVGITWTAKPEGIVEITAGDDGTATVRPLKGGKTTVTVKEPGGKSTKLTVSVLVPVESVELSHSGKTKPGGTVTFKAALSPKKVGNKDLEWSVDVGEDIATISAKGALKISKTAPDGTVITVTCKALGAAEPIIATEQITVGE